MPEDRHPGTPGGGSGADVKSGKITNVNDGDTGTVTFNTPFSSVPVVCMAIGRGGGGGAVDLPQVTYAPSATDFDWRLLKGHGGSAHDWTLYWIATDAGDP